MKFRDPKTGEVYEVGNRDITDGFCSNISCGQCAIYKICRHGNCTEWVMNHPAEAARLMGYEVVGESDHDAKADTDKPHPTLVPVSLISAVTAIREYGTAKYGDSENWRRVEPQRYRDALYRHWLAYLGGEQNDQESGYPHLWHLACNVAFLIELEGHDGPPIC